MSAYKYTHKEIREITCIDVSTLLKAHADKIFDENDFKAIGKYTSTHYKYSDSAINKIRKWLDTTSPPGVP